MADSTRTDPRFHPAYQRGYRGQGAPGVSATPAEERFRRPRGAEAGELRRSTRSEEPGPIRPRRPRPASAPEPSPMPAAAALPSAPAVETDGAQAPVGGVDTETGAAAALRPSALDRRVPLALAVLGVLFLVSGVGLLWSATSAMYGGYSAQQSELDRFVSAVTNYLAGPAVTIGLLSIGAAIAVRAARS